VVEDAGNAGDRSELDALRRRLEEAERARDEAEALFRAVFDSNLVMMSLTDATTGRYLRVNAAFERTTGFSAAEAVGKDSAALGILPPPRVLERVRAELAAHGVTQPMAMVVVDPVTHEERDVLFAGAMVATGAGPLLVTVAHDPTRMSRDIAEVRSGTDRLRVILDSLPDGVFFADSLGNVVECNRAALEQLGYSREELIGLPLSAVSGRADFDFEEARGRVPVGATIHRETIHRRKDGSLVPVELSMTGIEYFGEVRWVGIARDITARKQADEARRRLEEQLHAAMKMDAVGQLAGGIAHDFNNMLTAVSSWAQLALMPSRSAEAIRADLREILAAAQRGAGLTAQLLAFSRKQILEPKVVDLNGLLASTLRMLGRLIGENVALSFEPGAGPSAVRVDAGQTEQVFVNLALNARDAMPDGGELVFSTSNVTLAGDASTMHVDAHEGDYVRLRVRDTGQGMPPDTLAHLFEPFFTTKGKGKGTGLGMSIIYGTVKRSGGFIVATSEVGVGTTFDLYFPLAEGVAARPASERPSAFPRGSETILLVEDEESVLVPTARFLRDQGFRVLTASRPDEALALAQAEGFAADLLLTDVVMPVMNGRDLYERVRQLVPGLRVVYMSGYTDDRIAQHGVLEEGIALVQKPFAFEILAQKIRDTLDA
jgi:PAS domain S-box-containing protein